MTHLVRKPTQASLALLRRLSKAWPGTALLYLAAAPSLWRLAVHTSHFLRALSHMAKMPLWASSLHMWHFTTLVLRIAWRRLMGKRSSPRWNFLVEVFVAGLRPIETFANHWDTCVDPVIEVMTKMDYIGELLARACHSKVNIEHASQGCPRPLTWVWFDTPVGKCAALPGEKEQDLVILYLHGGGYFAFTGRSHMEYVARLAKEHQAVHSRTKACIVDLRRAPEHPWPAPLEDALACYDWLQAGAGYKASQIFLAGDSAGGGLCLCLLLALRDAGKPLPLCATVISPFTDLARTEEQYPSYDMLQTDFIPARATIASARRYVRDGQDPKNPLISPKYGELHSLPPVLIQAGERELLARDSIEMAQRFQVYGGNVRLEMYPDMPHIFPAFACLGLEDAQTAIARQAAFVQGIRNGALEVETPMLLGSRLRILRRDNRTQSFDDVRTCGDTRSNLLPSCASSPALGKLRNATLMAASAVQFRSTLCADRKVD